MGNVNGYLNDVLFIIQAFANVFNSGSSVKLYISGPCNEYASDRIREVALQYNYPVQNIKLLGYLPEKELNKYCRNAYLFVVPLWNDED